MPDRSPAGPPCSSRTSRCRTRGSLRPQARRPRHGSARWLNRRWKRRRAESFLLRSGRLQAARFTGFQGSHRAAGQLQCIGKCHLQHLATMPAQAGRVRAFLRAFSVCVSVQHARILRNWPVRIAPPEYRSRAGCERPPDQQDKCAEEIALMKPESRTADALRASLTTTFLVGGGEMGALIRAHDWNSTSLGAPENWPQGLKTAIRIMLTSRQPIWIGWGPELLFFYNDPYKSIIGGKHPVSLGQPTEVVWHEIWSDIAPLLATAMTGYEGTFTEQKLLIMERNGFPEETYYTFSYSPIPNDDGSAGGIICANSDDTARVIGERQLMLLRDLAASTADARLWRDACELSVRALQTDARDIPFALLYMAEPGGADITLAGASGIAPGHRAAPEAMRATEAAHWPFAEVLRTQTPVVVSDLAQRFGPGLPSGPWSLELTQAVVLPIMPGGETARAGVLVAALNPCRLLDDGYRAFLNLAAGQIGAAIGYAHAYKEE